MASNKLKAWVRYDGNGRAASGPVLGYKKPKVGNWKEITAYKCCDSPTTTTTTTLGPTTTTTTTSVSAFDFLSTQNNDPLITENGENIVL